MELTEKLLETLSLDRWVNFEKVVKQYHSSSLQANTNAHCNLYFDICRLQNLRESLKQDSKDKISNVFLQEVSYVFFTHTHHQDTI